MSCNVYLNFLYKTKKNDPFWSEKWYKFWKQVQYFCKDPRNKNEVPDPTAKDLIRDKIWKRSKSKADLTVLQGLKKF